MSLEIYFRGVDILPDARFEEDAETFFTEVHLDGSDYDKVIISEIEKGEYVDDLDFKDRYGRTLPRSFMSTGTKIALALYHRPEVMLWGIEMGRNALAEVVRYCNRGILVLEESNFYVADDILDTTIDVVCKGDHYTSLHKFSTYMMEVAPYDD